MRRAHNTLTVLSALCLLFSMLLVFQIGITGFSSPAGNFSIGSKYYAYYTQFTAVVLFLLFLFLILIQMRDHLHHPPQAAKKPKSVSRPTKARSRAKALTQKKSPKRKKKRK